MEQKTLTRTHFQFSKPHFKNDKSAHMSVSLWWPTLPAGLPLFTQVCIRIRTLEMQTFQIMLEVSEYPGSSLLIDLDMTLPLIYTKIPLVFPMAQLTLFIHIKAQTPLGVSH